MLASSQACLRPARLRKQHPLCGPAFHLLQGSQQRDRRLRLRFLIAFTCLAGIHWLAAPVLGDGLDDVRQRGELVWAADEQGGAPFAYREVGQPGQLVGFEVELAGLIAGRLGVRPRFQQGQWEQLPLLLERRLADVVLNAYEWTPERARRFGCSRPYYLFGLQLVARRDGPIDSWESLARLPSGQSARIGILGGSESHIRRYAPAGAQFVFYENNPDALQHVAAGLLDASIADDCIMQTFLPRYPELVFVGRPVGNGYYVALCRKEDARLLEEINRSIGELIQDGSLERLYDRWKLNGRWQALALRDAAVETPAAGTRSNVVRSSLGLLLQSAGMTVLLAVLSMPLAMAVGLVVALGRLYGARPIAFALAAYVEVLRGTPLMLQLYAIFFLLPEIGLAVPALVAAVLGLAINYSAYESEIYRAGLEAVPRGQMEAALALGLSRGQALRHVILPQTFRIVLPPVTNDFIALFKDTSVCSVVTVVELTKRYNMLAQNTGAIVELASVTALLYLAMSYPLARLARRAERSLAGAPP